MTDPGTPAESPQPEPQAVHPQAPYPQAPYPNAPYPNAPYPNVPYPPVQYVGAGFSGGPPMPPPVAPRSRTGLWVALALVGVVLLAGLGVGGFLLVRFATADDPCESVAAAATDGLATVLTIDGTDLDGYRARATERVTPELWEPSLEKTAKMVEAMPQPTSTVATVRDAKVVSCSDSHAVVDVVADSRSSSAGMPPASVSSQVRLTLVRVDGEWLIDKAK